MFSHRGHGDIGAKVKQSHADDKYRGGAEKNSGFLQGKAHKRSQIKQEYNQCYRQNRNQRLPKLGCKNMKQVLVLLFKNMVSDTPNRIRQSLSVGIRPNHPIDLLL